MTRQERIKMYRELQLALAAAITLGTSALDISAATTNNYQTKMYADNFNYATAGIGVEMVSDSEITKKKNRAQRREEKRK